MFFNPNLLTYSFIDFLSRFLVEGHCGNKLRMSLQTSLSPVTDSRCSLWDYNLSSTSRPVQRLLQWQLPLICFHIVFFQHYLSKVFPFIWDNLGLKLGADFHSSCFSLSYETFRVCCRFASVGIKRTSLRILDTSLALSLHEKWT